MKFPTTRMRRIRKNASMRRLVRETRVSTDDLIYPLFVVHGREVKKEIASMPGNFHFSPDALVEEVKDVADLGIPAVLLFGLPEKKDPVASEAYDENGIIQVAVRELKKHVPGILLITDVCLCEYTSHGHCGVIDNGDVKNDETLELLARTALSHVEAGADMILTYHAKDLARWLA